MHFGAGGGGGEKEKEKREFWLFSQCHQAPPCWQERLPVGLEVAGAGAASLRLRGAGWDRALAAPQRLL